MKYLPLLWSGLWRRPVRTVLTTLSIAVAFVLFGVLHGVVAGFDRAIETMSDARLRVMNRANLFEALPIAYATRIAAVPGVNAVSHATVMVTYYQDPSNGVTAAALDMDSAAVVFNEMKVPSEQFDAVRRLRTGALVGGFSLNNDGGFTIAGLKPGTYTLRTEPLDDADISSFFDSNLDIDVNFGARFHDRVVVVPPGGGTRDVEVKVTPK